MRYTEQIDKMILVTQAAQRWVAARIEAKAHVPPPGAARALDDAETDLANCVAAYEAEVKK